MSTNEVSQNLTTKKYPVNQIIRKWPPKGVFANLLEKYLGLNAGLWSLWVCFWIFENFLKASCDVCEKGSVWNGSYYKWQYTISFQLLFLFSKFLCDVFYYYHGMIAYITRQVNDTRLRACGVHSWQIIDFCLLEGIFFFTKSIFIFLS